MFGGDNKQPRRIEKRSPVSSTLCKASSFPFEHTFLKHFIMQIALDIEYFISNCSLLMRKSFVFGLPKSGEIYFIFYHAIFILSFNAF